MRPPSLARVPSGHVTGVAERRRGHARTRGPARVQELQRAGGACAPRAGRRTRALAAEFIWECMPECDILGIRRVRDLRFPASLQFPAARPNLGLPVLLVLPRIGGDAAPACLMLHCRAVPTARSLTDNPVLIPARTVDFDIAL